MPDNGGRDFAYVAEYFRNSEFLQVYSPLPKGLSNGFILTPLEKALKTEVPQAYSRMMSDMIIKYGQQIGRLGLQVDGNLLSSSTKEIMSVISKKWLGAHKKSNPVASCLIYQVNGILYEAALRKSSTAFFMKCLSFYMAGYWPCGYRRSGASAKFLVAR